jgi:hypothetical protein
MSIEQKQKFLACLEEIREHKSNGPNCSAVEGMWQSQQQPPAPSETH